MRLAGFWRDLRLGATARSSPSWRTNQRKSRARARASLRKGLVSRAARQLLATHHGSSLPMTQCTFGASSTGENALLTTAALKIQPAQEEEEDTVVRARCRGGTVRLAHSARTFWEGRIVIGAEPNDRSLPHQRCNGCLRSKALRRRVDRRQQQPPLS